MNRSLLPGLPLAGCLLGLLGSRLPAEPQDLGQAAAEIDRLIEARLAAEQQKPNPLVDDATFLRRAYLQIVGRIPDAEEAQAFLQQKGRDRRTELVDRLFASPGHDSHEFHWLADLLRARSRLMRQTSGEPFVHYLKQSIAQDKPFDVLVREMLTASGPAGQRGNGATGYLLRDLGMPEDSTANTLRVFLGTRLECAQCHNHPFDKWTQRQFYEMNAFLGGLQYRSGFEQSEAGMRLREVARELAQEHGQQAQAALRRLAIPAAVGLRGAGTGLARLPDTYKYDDARPNEPIAAKTIFGRPVALDVQAPPPPQRRRPARGGPVGRDVDSRAAFADWLVASDNPRFALVLANRLWKRTFGVGLIEPVDDLKDDTQASHPELLRYLEQLIVQLDFDTERFQRVLMRTKLFQRASCAWEPGGAPFLFAGPLLRRMTAEQVWDSLLTLVVPDLDATLRPPGARAEEVYRAYERLSQASAEDLAAEVEAQVLRQKDPEKFRALQRERFAAREREVRPLVRELALAQRRGDEAVVTRIRSELQKLGVPVPGERRRGGADELVRASDLPSPAPPNHLLAQFGQSDRDTVEAAHQEATVPQVLTLLNGFVDQRVFEPGSVLRRRLAAGKDDADRLRAAYLSILNRAPDAKETALWRGELAQRGDAAVRDLVWVLINSNEFRFVR
jgi:hypothetical protein